MGRGAHGWHGGFGHGCGWGHGYWGPGPGLLLGEAALLGAGAGYLAAGGGRGYRRGYYYGPPVTVVQQAAPQVVVVPDRLVVAVHAATGLPETAWLGRQDVRCDLLVYRAGALTQQARTCVVSKGGATPVFDGRYGSTVSFSIVPVASSAPTAGSSALDGVSMVVRLVAVNTFSADEQLGAATVPVRDVADGVVRDYALQPAGTLTLTVHHVPGQQPQQQQQAQQQQYAQQQPVQRAAPVVAQAAPAEPVGVPQEAQAAPAYATAYPVDDDDAPPAYGGVATGGAGYVPATSATAPPPPPPPGDSRPEASSPARSEAPPRRRRRRRSAPASTTRVARGRRSVKTFGSSA
mmetsp:Transcript_4634/g.18875  ORF Transcript_4634/g.18875 Transcript_4634/m.18875 type:complete len:349 (+) Transcript_4634:19-1065(+)